MRRDCYLENRDPEAFFNLNWANIEAYYCGETDRLVLIGADPSQYRDRPSVVCVTNEADKKFEQELGEFENSVNGEVGRRQAHCSIQGILDAGPSNPQNYSCRRVRPLLIRRGPITSAPIKWRYGQVFVPEHDDGDASGGEAQRRLVEEATANKTNITATTLVEQIQGPKLTGSLMHGELLINPPKNSDFSEKLKDQVKKLNKGRWFTRPKEYSQKKLPDIRQRMAVIKTVITHLFRKI
ncbi:hypothetical protein TWF730_008446 [Orbilia blumenaviensis]|uniref:Uncharacterized protein n=1 Tax=Orbilia blumenaviensis TaxID=1796055 RepID=A0AAV9V2D5_9PEZI